MDRRGASPDALAHRARIVQAIRAFFDGRSFLEVDTPVRVPVPAMELHIDAPESGVQYLRTSPELHLKRLLADGMERVYSLGPCFRANERGVRHHPEFTMLEWYEAGGDYLSVLGDTQALFAALGIPVDWETRTVSKAFLDAAGWDPVVDFDADRFDLDLVELVEPSLPPDQVTVLIDYPAEVAALARRKPGNEAVAERWECYWKGLELANAYTELTDPLEQRRRFEACARQREALGQVVYQLDEAFLSALERMPPSGGIALGVDRLLMAMSDASTIDQVRAFVQGD